MKLRICILTVTLLSYANILAQNKSPQPLSQFTMDVILNMDLQNGLDTLMKYRESENFYVAESELFNVGQLLYRQNLQDEALQFMKFVQREFVELSNSLAQHLFVKLIEDGVDSTEQWLIDNPYQGKFYLSESEFDMASTTLLSAKQMGKCKIINTIYLNEFPDNQEAHFQMADIYYDEGNTELGLQYFRSGVATESYVSFSSLVSNPLSEYIPTVLSSDTTKLFKYTGDISNDTAWVFIQGGPMPDISAYNPRPLTLLPRQEDLLKIDVLQSQMINQSILSSAKKLTDAQNLYEHGISAEMMHRTVSYLKSKDKVVFVIAHSYGAYISFEYLHSKKNLADRLIIMGGDLDEDLRNYELNEDGSRKFIRFRNGVTPYESAFWGNFTLESLFKEKLEKIFTNTGGLVASHGKRRFTNLLRGKNLSNVIFYHAKFDEANGRTSKSDIEFFKTHGATTIETYGDHHSMLTNQIFENLYNYLSNDSPLLYSLTSILADEIEVNGIEKAIESYHNNNFIKTCFPINETEINTLGYQLVADGKLEEAIQIFRLNAEAFPYSWNVYDSLAESYISQGRIDLGKQYYHKSLELHPGNIYAIMALRQL